MNKNVVFAGSGGGGGSEGGHIAANTLYNNSDLRVLDLISEGQIGGLVDGAKSIFFDNVPLQNASGSFNYDNVEVDWVNGTPTQKILKGFGETVIPQAVGREAKNGLPVTEAIQSANADMIRVVVSLPSLYSQDDDGNINGTSVSIRFEMSVNNSGNWTHLGDYTISGKQSSQYERTYQFEIPKKDSEGNKANTWLIKMTRLSEDSSERYSARTILDTIYAVNLSYLNYPHCAIVGVKANAANISKIPTRSYLVDGLIIKIPSNYDPETNTYSDPWDGTFKMAVSSNPAWILYALLTNERWGLGNFIKPEQVNKARLYEIGRYCDELVDDGYGNKEKRFTINTQIQERSDAYRLISDITAVFRGMAYWAGGTVDFTCDKPTDPTMLYSAANVINGVFTYQGSSRNDRHSVVLVTWNDPEQNYNKVVEYVEDAELLAKYGVRQYEVTLFGCTSRAQAIRAGKWILYTESFESDMITFSVGLDSALVVPGDIIKIQDPSYAGKRMGGRLVEVGTTYAVLDNEVELTPNNDSVISLMMPDGSFVERDILVGYKGNYTKVSWNEPLTDLPVGNAVWVISEATLVPITARVVNIQQGETPGTFNITAVSHQPKKFDLIEKGIKFDEEPTTSDPYDVGDPTVQDVEEIATALGLGYVSSIIRVRWLSGRNNVSFELRWRREEQNETDWETIQTESKFVDIQNVQNGRYHFVLRGIGLMGNKSGEVDFYYTANGQYLTPIDVTDFQVIKRPSYLEVRWSPAEGASSYEVRCGKSWDESEILIENFAGTSFVHYQYEEGEYNYFIRSISPTGDYSPNVGTYKLILKAPATPVDFIAVVAQGRIDFTWKANKEDDLSHYEIREGTSWESGIKVAESKVSQMSIPGGTTEKRRFWVKAIALPKIYSRNAAWTEIYATPDDSRNLIIKHDARLMRWSSNAVYMRNFGDSIVMEDDRSRSEYIAELDLLGRITAQNSFYTQVYTTVRSTDDTESWETALYNWESVGAQRAWRLGGDASTIEYENQIARHVGLIDEYEGWSLEENLNSEKGIAPTVFNGIKYDWGRYTKGLNVTDTTGASWDGNFVTAENADNFKFSFWIKTKAHEANSTYNIIKFGNESHCLTMTYNSEDNVYRLISDEGDVLDIESEMKENEHVFFAISQTEDTRVFGIGILGGQKNIKTGFYKPIGEIKYLKLGTECV